MNAFNHARRPLRARLLGPMIALGLLPATAAAQDHSHMHMPMPMPARKAAATATPGAAQPAGTKPAVAKPRRKPAHPGQAASHPSQPVATPMGETTPETDHATIDHGGMAMPSGEAMPGMDHATMDHGMPMPMGDTMPGMAHGAAVPPGYEPRVPVPALTDADRAAAFPEASDHTTHDNAVHSFTLLNRLEGWNADGGTAVAWQGQAWIGTDLDKLWLRSEGERIGGRLQDADLEVLYGRSVARWWDLLAGVRHDFKPGPAQDFLALGVSGLAPQKIELAATAYLGQGGQTALRLEAERELLLTNRLILQPLLEANAYGTDDASRGTGAGLATVEAGLRLRYEVTRRFAPYLGVTRERAFGRTARYRRAAGEATDDTRVVAGVRIWF